MLEVRKEREGEKSRKERKRERGREETEKHIHTSLQDLAPTNPNLIIPGRIHN